MQRLIRVFYATNRGINPKKVIVVHFNKNGDLNNSKPCKNCVEFLRKRGVKKIMYSDEHGEIVSLPLKRINSEECVVSNGWVHYMKVSAVRRSGSAIPRSSTLKVDIAVRRKPPTV